MPESGIRGRPVAVIDAPSNLGLRPPEDGVSPGVYKLAGALRDTEGAAGKPARRRPVR
jgi:hypothetical protein